LSWESTHRTPWHETEIRARSDQFAIINPANGDFIGTRDIMTSADDGVSINTVGSSDSITNATADKLGDPPAR
jgi:hypothetical protein